MRVEGEPGITAGRPWGQGPGERPAGDGLAARGVATIDGLDAGEQKQPVYVTDNSGRVILANGAYRRIEAALAATGFIAGGDAIATAVAALGRPLLQDHVLELDGRRLCFTSRRSLLTDATGERVGICGRFSPADELRAAEASRDLYRERLLDLERLVSDWVWETDAAGALSHLSEQVLARLGRHPAELVGRRLADLLDHGGVELEALYGADERRPFAGLRVEIGHRDGTRRVFLLSGVPLFEAESGIFGGYRGTAQDVTERESATQALLKAVGEAEAASRAKSQFLAHMSHELRTPLNAIIGFAELISLQTMGPIGNPKYQEYAGDILASSRHLLELINDVLDLAKVEAGKLPLDEGVVTVEALFRDVVRVIAEPAARAGVDLVVGGHDGLPHIRGDERRLTQILLNLLSNAVKFTPKGGEIGLAARRAPDGGMVISVSDTGIGIPADKIGAALEPFVQVDSGMTRRFDGTGLGLPLARALTELHDGKLEITSEAGRGTEARVRLPVSRIVQE